MPHGQIFAARFTIQDCGDDATFCLTVALQREQRDRNTIDVMIFPLASIRAEGTKHLWPIS